MYNDVAFKKPKNFNDLGVASVYTFTYNRCKKGNLSYLRAQKDFYPRTNLKFCPSCCQFKTGRKFSRYYCKKCKYKMHVMLNKCAAFINKSPKKHSGACLALRKLMGALLQLDEQVSIDANRISEFLIENEAHLSTSNLFSVKNIDTLPRSVNYKPPVYPLSWIKENVAALTLYWT